MAKSWVWRSDLNSVDEEKISILAIIETIIAISIGIYIWQHYNTYLHILIGLIVAPFLLLRTEKSTKEGLKLFIKFLYEFINKFRNKINSRNRIYIYLSTLLFFSIGGWSIYDTKGLMIGFLIAFIKLFFYEIIRKNKYDNILDKIGNGELLVFVLVFVLLSIIAKICSIIKNLSLESIKSIPKNWKKIVLSTDSFYPPEIMPNIENSNFLIIKHFKFSNWINLKNSDFGNKLAVVLLTPSLFLPALIYRYSLKATALVYLPIIWLIVPSNRKNLTDRMRVESKIFIAYMMFFYSLVVVFGFTLLPFYLNIKAIEISYHIPEFIPKDIYSIFLTIEFDLWHLTRLLASIITIVFFISFQKILQIREGEPTYGDFWGAKLLSLDYARKALTLFTLGCTIYLMYASSIPNGYMENVWHNMKLLPIEKEVVQK